MANRADYYGAMQGDVGVVIRDGVALHIVPLPPLVELPAKSEATACFASGTRILTTRGDVRVEDIQLGDMVVLAEDDPAPVIWVGWRDVRFAGHAAPQLVRPVRIKAGALGTQVPERDLIVSPDHGIYLEGSLVQAKDLIDGVVITQDFAVSAMRYYHIELKAHAILLAEGAPVESYLDTGHRGIYDNAAAPVLLHPQLMQARRQSGSVAPLVTGGEALAEIRARLHARKLMLGFAVNETTRTGLLVNGALLAPAEDAAERISFNIPAGVSQVILASPIFVPAEIDPGSNDRRGLGIAVIEVLVDGKAMKLEDVANPADLHKRSPRETATWTRGAVRLTLPAGTATISFIMAAWPRVWQRREAA